jgi:hypothetical protein
MATPKVVAEYIGTAGEFRPGVPATDLNEEQFDALTEDDRTWVLANAESARPIYKLHGRDIKAEAKEVAAEAPVLAVEPLAAPVAPSRAQPAARSDKAD